ncbi:ganglioside GM2 activator-like [Ruditapes philippinarum]|uniref:ganglioside GM2 activator-like n=1 Tax=Ruditapes philippinarum TaxID=129788 RepID=UPI00295C0F1B|nr:ganglioside GM2 activator-like [Ruditapes philippinarum]
MAYFESLTVCILCIFAVDFVSSQRHIFKESVSSRNFSYSNCNSSVVPLYVNFLDISPDPIIIGNSIKIRLRMTLDEDAGSHNNTIKVDLSLRMKTKTGYIELCQIVGESYCHYNDLCSILKDFMKDKKCPEYIQKKYDNNCGCPFIKRSYDLPPIQIVLPQLSYKVRGKFVLTINLHEEGKILGCVEIQFCITDCNPLGYR